LRWLAMAMTYIACSSSIGGISDWCVAGWTCKVHPWN
jgi:hypothetical protein